MADFEGLSKSEGDAELQEFLMIEKQKAQVNAQVMVIIKSVWIGNEEEIKSVRNTLVMANAGNFPSIKNDSNIEWKQSQCNTHGTHEFARIVLNCQQNSHPFQTRTIFLEPNAEVKVGRSIARNRVSDNNAIFDCKVLSRNHAVLWYSDGKFYVKDTRSSNGTFINDRRIDQSEAEVLSSGDIVKFGVDVIENSRKEVHGCIIACVKLFSPDGREIICSDQSRNKSGDGTISLDELHRLQHFIQEANQRERILEVKLHDVQTVIETTRRNTSSWWQAMIDEDKLLNRIDILENKLEFLQKNVPEDRLKLEILKLQDDKSVYQNSAKEALRKVYQERMDALHKLATIERALCNSEDECSLLRDQLLRTQQSLKEVNCHLTRLENECKEQQKQNEQDRADLEKEENHPLYIKLKEADEECQEYKSQVNMLLTETKSLQKQIEHYEKLNNDESNYSLCKKSNPSKSTILKWFENSDLSQKEGSTEIIQAICSELESTKKDESTCFTLDSIELRNKLRKVQEQISFLESGILNDGFEEDTELISSSSLSDGNQNIEVKCDKKDTLKSCTLALIDIYKDINTYICDVKQNCDEIANSQESYKELEKKLNSVQQELLVLQQELQTRPSYLQMQEEISLNEKMQLQINSLKKKIVELESDIIVLQNDKILLEGEIKNIECLEDRKDIGLQTSGVEDNNQPEEFDVDDIIKKDSYILNNSAIRQEEELVTFKEKYEILTNENIKLKNDIISLNWKLHDLQQKFLAKLLTYGVVFTAILFYLLSYFM